MRSPLLVPLLLLLGCSETGVLHEYPIPVLTLELDGPAYGAFTGADLVVRGRVSPTDAVVVVEDEVVPVGRDGTFSVTLGYDKPYRLLDVSADYLDQHLEERLPVFWGLDPLASWPGAITMRLTEAGLDGIAALLQDVILSGITEQLAAGDIPLGGDGIDLEVVAVTVGGSDVSLTPSDRGLDFHLSVDDLIIDTIVHATVFEQPLDVPAAITLPVVGFDALLELGIDEGTGGIVAGVSDVAIRLDVPEITLFDADLGFLSDLIAGAVDLEGLINDQLAGALDGLADLPLGGPIAFETDLLGTAMALELSGLSTDRRGVGIALGVGLGGPVPADAGRVPYPRGQGEPAPDLAVAVHDGLLQLLLASDLLDLLDQDLELPGFIGGFLSPLISGLPGGEQLPANNGFCIGLRPGDAKVARFGVGDAPLVGIYLPVSEVTFGYLGLDGLGCTDWLVTSLAMEVYLGLGEGTSLDLDIEVAEGVVLSYGAEGADEDEVVARLGDVIETLLGLLGGLGGLDLGSLLGGGGDGGALGGLGLEGLNLQLGQGQPMLDGQGQPIEGMVELGIGLFGE